MEIYATNALPDEQIMSIKLFAKDLVLLLAFHLAERIASLLRQVLDHSSKVLYDPENEVLFLPSSGFSQSIESYSTRPHGIGPVGIVNCGGLQVDW